MLERDIKVFPEEENQYHCQCNKNLSEEKKQGLVEYGRTYYVKLVTINNYWK